MTDAKENDKKDEDPRLEFILQYLICSSKLKTEKWAKMMGTEEFKVIFIILLIQLNSRIICLFIN